MFSPCKNSGLLIIYALLKPLQNLIWSVGEQDITDEQQTIVYG